MAAFVGLALTGTACSQDAAAPSAQPPTSTDASVNTRVFDCAGDADIDPFEFTIRLGPGELALWLPFDFGRPYLVLAQDFALADASYREGDVLLTLKQDMADLAVGDQSFSDCSLNRVRSRWEHAKLSGMDYRATGTDPDWYAELGQGRSLVFVNETEDIRIEVPTPTPAVDAASSVTTYQSSADGQSLVLSILPTVCSPNDGTSMRGSEVTVIWNGRAFRGCGRALH